MRTANRARAFGADNRKHGAKSLDDLLGRCRVDDVTGCWQWTGGCSRQAACDVPMTYVAAGVLEPQRKCMSAYRAAWLLAGNTVHPGHVVWRHHCNNDLCINPDHCRSGTRKQMQKAIAATGRNKGSAERSRINTINRAAMTTPPDVVRFVEDLLRSGRMCKDVSAIAGVSKDTVTSIKRGRHPYCRHKQTLVRGASVFSLGAA